MNFKKKPKDPTTPSPASTYADRFKDKARWRTSFTEVLIWFMFGGILTTMLSMFTPGYPILVGTPSIQQGLYWLSRLDTSYAVGDLVSFPFKPAQDWIRERYATEKLVHTKKIVGAPGDTVFADSQLNLKVCRRSYLMETLTWCMAAGKPRDRDSKGRDLYPWLKADSSYTLKSGEYWIQGQHPNSLDSRYHGPVASSQFLGKAKLILAYGDPPEMEIPLDRQKFQEIEPPSSQK